MTRLKCQFRLQAHISQHLAPTARGLAVSTLTICDLSFVIRALRGALLLACLLAATGPRAFGADEQAFGESFRNPAPVVADGVLYLFAQGAASDAEGDEATVCLRQDGPNVWTRIATLRGSYSCITYGTGVFHLFTRDSVIRLNKETCGKVGEDRWPYNWQPQSAEMVGGVLTAFGVGEDGRLYVATWSEGETTQPDHGQDGRAANRGQDARDTTEPARGTTEPSGSRWVEQPLAGTAPGVCREVRSLVCRDELRLFWTCTAGEGGGGELWSAVLKDGRLAGAAKVAVMEGEIGFAAAAFAGSPTLIYGKLPQSLCASESLVCQRYYGDHWLPFVAATELSNAMGEITYRIAAAGFENRVVLFLEAGVPIPFDGVRTRILRSNYSGLTWTEPAPVLSDPVYDWMMGHMELLYGALLVLLALLIVSFIRAVFLPRRAHIGGVDYRLAPWWQRGGAYAVDLAIVFWAVVAIHALSGQPVTYSGEMICVFVTEMIYFTDSEARAGRTLGKRLFGLIVLSRNGGYPSWSEAGLRNVTRALCDSILLPIAFVGWLVGLMFILNSRGSRRVGDRAAGTYVVREHSN